MFFSFFFFFFLIKVISVNDEYDREMLGGKIEKNDDGKNRQSIER